MIVRNMELTDVYQTGREMRRLVENYWNDLGPWLNVSFLEYFNHVCELPYVPDPPEVETVSRPLYTLDPGYVPRDCDDKAVLLACWFHGNGRKSRFVASSTRYNRELHHTFIQIVDGIYLDATYKNFSNRLGFYPYFPKLTRVEVLTDWL